MHPGKRVSRGFVLKLNKSCYGIKSASHYFWIAMDKHLYKIGGVPTNVDLWLYRRCSGTAITVIGLIIDDIVCVTSKDPLILLGKLKQRFKKTYDGELSYVLGLHVTRDLSTGHVFLDQQGYIKKVDRAFRWNVLRRPVYLTMPPSQRSRRKIALTIKERDPPSCIVPLSAAYYTRRFPARMFTSVSRRWAASRTRVAVPIGMLATTCCAASSPPSITSYVWAAWLSSCTSTAILIGVVRMLARSTSAVPHPRSGPSWRIAQWLSSQSYSASPRCQPRKASTRPCRRQYFSSSASAP